MSSQTLSRSDAAGTTPARAAGLVRWFEHLSACNADLASGKGANLGELVSFGMPVPHGFVLTSDAFWHFLDAAGLRRAPLLEQVNALDVDDTAGLTRAAQELQTGLWKAPLPDELQRTTLAAYRELAKRCESDAPFVAVRSSATAEDMPGTSFPG